MKVLVLAQYFPPDMSGSSTRVSNVVRGLLKKGCEVVVVAAFPHYPLGNVPEAYRRMVLVSERFGSAKFLRVWVPALPHNSVVNRIVLHLCFCISSLLALPFVGKVDVVWGANPNLFSFFPSLVYGFVRHVPIVRNVDDLWPEVFYELGLVQSTLMRKILDFLAWLSYIIPKAITPISESQKRWIVERYKVSAEKVYVVEVGAESVKPLASNGSTRAGRFVVMYSGVLGLGYDFDVVLEGAKILRENQDVVFVIRGVGELGSRLKNRISDLNLRNVVLDTSFLPKDELDALLGSADVFVLPMTSGGFVDFGLPTKVFEYQAYGKPIICVSGGEPARYVEATGSGLVVKPKDAYGFVKAVMGLYENRKLAAEFGLKGWQHVSTNLTIEKIGERIYEVLASAARGWKSG